MNSNVNMIYIRFVDRLAFVSAFASALGVLVMFMNISIN